MAAPKQTLKYEVPTLALTYQAYFVLPFFRISDARTAIVERLYRGLIEFGVSPSDLFSYGGTSLADQRIRISLFRGNGTVEITADRVEATFRNALRDDVELMKKCLIKLVESLESYSSDAPLASERYVMYPTIVAETQKERDEFLITLGGENKVPKVIEEKKGRIVPSYKVEFEQPDEGWHFDLTVSRAWNQPRNIFISANMNFNNASSRTIGDRLDYFGKAIGGALAQIGLGK